MQWFFIFKKFLLLTKSFILQNTILWDSFEVLVLDILVLLAQIWVGWLISHVIVRWILIWFWINSEIWLRIKGFSIIEITVNRLQFRESQLLRVSMTSFPLSYQIDLYFPIFCGLLFQKSVFTLNIVEKSISFLFFWDFLFFFIFLRVVLIILFGRVLLR